MARINQRIEDVTGLTMSTAESLQVLNYGVGGHYVPHYDYFEVSSNLSANNNNNVFVPMIVQAYPVCFIHE